MLKAAEAAIGTGKVVVRAEPHGPGVSRSGAMVYCDAYAWRREWDMAPCERSDGGAGHHAAGEVSGGFWPTGAQAYHREWAGLCDGGRHNGLLVQGCAGEWVRVHQAAAVTHHAGLQAGASESVRRQGGAASRAGSMARAG